jgi:hypothetical protein
MQSRNVDVDDRGASSDSVIFLLTSLLLLGSFSLAPPPSPNIPPSFSLLRLWWRTKGEAVRPRVLLSVKTHR